VALDEVYVEGLLHVTDLGNDYFIHDKARHEMVGERTGVRYRLGDRLTVKVVRVDLETSRIDFTLVSAAEGAADGEGSALAEGEQSASIRARTPKTSRASAPAKAAPAAWAKSIAPAQKSSAAAKSSSAAKPSRTASDKPAAGKGAAGKSRSAKDKGRHSVQKNKGKPKAKAR